MGRLDAEARRLAAGQYGVVTRSQLVELGFGRGQLARRLQTGELVAVHRGVYVVTGVPPTPEQAILAAVRAQGPDAVASHRSAAWVWGLPGGRPAPAEVSVAGRRRHELAAVVCHQHAAVLDDTTGHCGIPVTTVARTLLDLGGVVRFAVFEAAAEQALLTGLTTTGRLREVYERVGGRGRAGSAALRAFLDERDAGVAPAESRLEVELLRLLRAHGLPPPVRQYEIAVPGHGRFRLDLAYPDVRLAIEADGRRWHSGATEFQRDRRRGNALLLVGWRILRFTWADVREWPERVVDEVRRALTHPRTFAG